ncbi:MAG TPA: LysR family transcriptional regulator [Burkholderiaceae bacterium]
MELDAIAVFVKVVETGGFSSAARALSMPKTTVSAKVAALEKRLGVTLLQRTTRKLRVTEAGETYFHHCASAVREIELGEAALRSTQEKPSGLLRITVPVDFGRTVMPPIVRAYLEKYPDTRVEMLVTNQVLDIVGEGLDLAVRAGALKDSTLVARRFFDAHFGLWAARSYIETLPPIVRPQQLPQARFVARGAARTLRLTKGKTEVEVAFDARVSADDMESVKSLVALGEGIGALPDFLVADEVAAGAIVPVLPEWHIQFGGAFYFVHGVRKYASPKVQAFIELAIQMRQQ